MAPRFACLWLPDLPLAAALRSEPELAGRALAITEAGERTNPLIVAGALCGLRAAAAQALAPELVLRRLAPEALDSAEQALFDVALGLTPRVERAAPGVLQLDLAGCEALFASTGGLLLALQTRLHSAGLARARVGIGPTRTLAWLAARQPGEPRAIGEAERARFLAPLTLELLEPPAALAQQLERWGVHTLGQLAQLPRAELGTRLGPEGLRLARRAAGEDLEPFRPQAPPQRCEERMQPEWALQNLEALGFALRAVLERLCARLRLRGLAARELWIELGLEGGERYARRVGLRGATAHSSVLLALARLLLARDPPRAPVERIAAIATPGEPQSAQGELFAPPQPAPGALAHALARLEALCGPGRVGSPLRTHTHRPESSALAPFAERRGAAAPTPPPSPSQDSAPPLAGVALRALRPPRPLRVQLRGELPEALELEGSAHAVLQSAGPWRLSGEWWTEQPFDRAYFDVALAGGGLYRIYCDLEARRWFMDGVYD